MANESNAQSAAASTWRAKQVYAMAAICLVVGLAIGYLFRGSQSPLAAQSPSTAQSNTKLPAQPGSMGGGKMPTLEEMKGMADKKAAPLLEKLKNDPNNKDLLLQIAGLYKSTHQFKEAAFYFDNALKIDPKDVALRTQLASCLYYSGDVDAAISQLQKALQYDPKDANSLFNLGMIKWQGKHDSKGAVAVWQQLLKSNPQLDSDRKATVQKLMADAQMQAKS